MKRGLTLLLILCLFLPSLSLADCPVLTGLSEEEALSTLDADASILEIVFPSVAGADACILRMNGETMMIDAASDSLALSSVLPALRAMDLDHIDTAFVSHPHDDHVRGFAALAKNQITFDRMISCFPDNANGQMILVKRTMIANGVAIAQVADGDSWKLGEPAGVRTGC